MNKVSKILLASAALIIVANVAAYAETTVIKTKTVIAPDVPEDASLISLTALDINNDSVLTMEEVGEKLFYVFDTDGNEIIDNIEFDQNSMMTITPMTKETTVTVDYYADGIVDKRTYTYEKFLQQTQLARFSNDVDGLSPREFIQDSFLALDDNDDKAIDLEEWKEAYIAMTIPATAEQERYN